MRLRQCSALARQTAPDAHSVLQVVLPDDPIPDADAIVGVGHVLNYLPDKASVDRALVAIAGALRQAACWRSISATSTGAKRGGRPGAGRMGEDWAIVTEFSVPRPERFVRQIATFLRNADGSWRRDDERHDNVLIDTARIPGLLREAWRRGVGRPVVQGASASPPVSTRSKEPYGLKAAVGIGEPEGCDSLGWRATAGGASSTA